MLPHLVQIKLLHQLLRLLPLSLQPLLEFFLHLVQVLVTLLVNFLLHVVKFVLYWALINQNSQLLELALYFVDPRGALILTLLVVSFSETAHFALDFFEPPDNLVLELVTLMPQDYLFWFCLDNDLVLIQFRL